MLSYFRLIAVALSPIFIPSIFVAIMDFLSLSAVLFCSAVFIFNVFLRLVVLLSSNFCCISDVTRKKDIG